MMYVDDSGPGAVESPYKLVIPGRPDARVESRWHKIATIASQTAAEVEALEEVVKNGAKMPIKALVEEIGFELNIRKWRDSVLPVDRISLIAQD